MHSHTFSIALTAALTAFLGLSGCSVANDIDRAVDCNDVCNRYQSCYDSSYDTAACRTRCANAVDGDGGRPFAANECDTCMDDRSCASAVFACAAPCAGILP